ncbi:MAG: nucleotide-binding protein [Desulfocapsaceae bacterium]|nr:nucleotide-binding protein [Desulfocapsaceae bacterium]
MATSSTLESSLIAILRRFIERGEVIRSKGDIKIGQLKMWNGGCRSHFKKIYGENHVVTKTISSGLIPDNVNVNEEFEKRLRLLKEYVVSIEKIGMNAFVTKSIGTRVFIGHGRSPMWRELKDFINDRLKLPWDEFNREAVAGITTFARISEMLDSASFAFLIMTAEDQHSNETTHARQNVVHEVGLFQGRLGPKKAIILLEQGCEEFSNIVGLSQIRFPKGHISAVFEEIRRVLERENIIQT